jgi:hypothetical protein
VEAGILSPPFCGELETCGIGVTHSDNATKQSGDRSYLSPLFGLGEPLDVEVQGELVRMRAYPDGIDFGFPLVGNVSFQNIWRENIAL